MGLISLYNHISEGREDVMRGFFTCLFPFHFLHELPRTSCLYPEADPLPISSYSDVAHMTLLIQMTSVFIAQADIF